MRRAAHGREPAFLPQRVGPGQFDGLVRPAGLVRARRLADTSPREYVVGPKLPSRRRPGGAVEPPVRSYRRNVHR